MRGQQSQGKGSAAIPILYLSQALGMAIGLDDKQTGIGHHLTPVKPERLCAAAAAKLEAAAQVTPADQPEATVQPNPSNEN